MADVDLGLHFLQTTWPGARLPHAWLFRGDGEKASTLDLCAHGAFSILTGIGGEVWADAAAQVSAETGVAINVHVIGPRRAVQGHLGDWSRIGETPDAGAILVRPDHHVAWRACAASRSRGRTAPRHATILA